MAHDINQSLKEPLFMATPGKAPAKKSAPAKKAAPAKKVVAKKTQAPEMDANLPSASAKSSKVWEYIKKNNLGSPSDKRVIVAESSKK